MNFIMGVVALTNEVKTFISENISSYEDLQVLLLMHEHPGRNWDAVDIAENLRIEPMSASTHLMNLHTRGLVEHNAARGPFYEFQYSLHSTSIAREQQISALAAAFERARAEVVDYIFQKSRGQLQSFADAFKVKKDK